MHREFARETSCRGGVLGSLLAIVTSFLVLWLVLEVGLRVIRVPGFEPVVGINQPDARIGWVKKPSSVTRKKTKEFDVRFAINAAGLRDDPEVGVAKPAGEKRVLVVGDSFVLGYTVDREDLFVDLLEDALDSPGQRVQVLNGGTEGWSTDQELVWLREEGLKFQPDLVVWCFYQNDVYWSGQGQYAGTPKPRFPATGDATQAEPLPSSHPPEPSWLARHSSIAGFLHLKTQGSGSDMVADVGGKWIPREQCVVLRQPPPGLKMDDCWNRVAACLRGLEKTAQEAKVPVLFVPIPSREQIQPEAAKRWLEQNGLDESQVDFGEPVRRAMELAVAANLPAVNPTPWFRAAAEAGQRLYFDRDWHIDPDGNRVLAKVIYEQLVNSPALKGIAPTGLAAFGSGPAPRRALWPFVVGALWLLLGTLYATSYRDESFVLAYVKVGALIGSVLGILWAVNFLVGVVPAKYAAYIGIAAVVSILGFVLIKSRSNLGVIFEIYGSFVRRGHWYMIPLLMIMLAIGSLLIVASSSPFVAPFIYTLF